MQEWLLLKEQEPLRMFLWLTFYQPLEVLNGSTKKNSLYVHGKPGVGKSLFITQFLCYPLITWYPSWGSDKPGSECVQSKVDLSQANIWVWDEYLNYYRGKMRFTPAELNSFGGMASET